MQTITKTRKASVDDSAVQADTSVIISVESVTKAYKRGRQKITVLNNISLDVRQGDFVALTGASGSGKSTLLQLIGGLDKPTSGAKIGRAHV